MAFNSPWWWWSRFSLHNIGRRYSKHLLIKIQNQIAILKFLLMLLENYDRSRISVQRVQANVMSWGALERVQVDACAVKTKNFSAVCSAQIAFSLFHLLVLAIA